MTDPESVGNQSREECEEGIDRMMTDPTPEERANTFLRELMSPEPMDPYKRVLEEIRTAVATERERCAKLAENWEYAPDKPTSSEGIHAAESIAAAIRQAPEPADD